MTTTNKTPSVVLTEEETVLFKKQDEAFLQKWKLEIYRMFDAFPNECINTIGTYDGGKQYVEYVSSGALLNKA